MNLFVNLFVNLFFTNFVFTLVCNGVGERAREFASEYHVYGGGGISV